MAQRLPRARRGRSPLNQLSVSISGVYPPQRVAPSCCTGRMRCSREHGGCSHGAGHLPGEGQLGRARFHVSLGGCSRQSWGGVIHEGGSRVTLSSGRRVMMTVPSYRYMPLCLQYTHDRLCCQADSSGAAGVVDWGSDPEQGSDPTTMFDCPFFGRRQSSINTIKYWQPGYYGTESQ